MAVFARDTGKELSRSRPKAFHWCRTTPGNPEIISEARFGARLYTLTPAAQDAIAALRAGARA